MATITKATFIENYAKKYLGFTDEDIKKIGSITHLSAMVKAKGCYQDIPDITLITNNIQAAAVCAGVKNMTQIALFTDKAHITALNVGYPVNSAVTFNNEYNVLGCFLSKNAPNCRDFNNAVQLKALTFGIAPDIAVKVSTDIHTAAILAGATFDDALKFTRHSQVQKLQKGASVEQVLNYDKQGALEDILAKLGANLPQAGLFDKYVDAAGDTIDSLSKTVINIDVEGNIIPTDSGL